MRREHNTPPLLPSGYRLLNYIESTGTQYIKTPYTNALDYHHEITFDTNAVTWIVGDVQGAGSVNDFGVNSNTGRGIIRFSQRYNTNVLSFGINTGWHTITVDKQGYSVDGVHTNWSSPATAASGRFTIQLFKSVDSNLAPAGKISHYCIKSYSNQSYIADYYAALRIADSKPGVYDIVNDSFLTNQGTGEFLYA